MVEGIRGVSNVLSYMYDIIIRPSHGGGYQGGE